MTSLTTASRDGGIEATKKVASVPGGLFRRRPAREVNGPTPCVCVPSGASCDVVRGPQRQWCRSVQLVIREGAHRGGRLTTVPEQEFERGGLRYPRLVESMPGIQL